VTKQKQTQKEVKIGRPNLVIGLTGPFGSGCGEMRKILEDIDFYPFKISDDIRKELEGKKKLIEKGKQNWRKILQDHGNEMRKGSQDYWIQKVVARIDKEKIGDSKIVIDGLRNFQEVREIRKIYPNFFLVAICAQKNERWQRVKNDYEGRYNEFERDDRRDRSEDYAWGQSVQKCVDDCDYVYYNNENFLVYPQGKEEPNSDKINRTLRKQADDFVPLMQGITDRPPHPEEVQMAAAYAQSNSSRCIKRHVGAVIAITKDSREFPISMGFNENPPHVSTCSELKVCCKDEDMAAKLKAKGKDIYCLSCGNHHTDLKEPWACIKCGESLKEWLYPSRNMELCTAIHAEERAILSLGGRTANGGRLYVTTFPCFQCARLILNAGIEKVIYVEAYPMKETTEFLEKNDVKVVPFIGFTARAFFRVFKKVN
jgi:deoxycytidylate deaminase